MREIPEDIMQQIDFLAYSFSKSMYSTLHSKEDLINDLVVEYLEKEPLSNIRTKGGWFIHFKNTLLNKYRINKNRRELFSKYVSANKHEQG